MTAATTPSELRLYYTPGTGRPVRAAWALEEVGAQYDAVAVADRGSAEHREQRHPLGRVPVLEIDGEPVFDSTALVLQVADLYPDSGLLAAPGGLDRGLAYQWALTAVTEGEANAVANMRLRKSHPDLADAATERYAAYAAALADALAGHEFLVADRFGAADIVTGNVLAIADRSGLVDGGPQIVADYHARLRARPAYARAAQRTESLFDPR